MQVKPAPASCHRKPRVDETDHPVALERLRVLKRIDALREDGLKLRQALKAVELPSSTHHDWRKALAARGVAGLVLKSHRPRRCAPRARTAASAASTTSSSTGRPAATSACPPSDASSPAPPSAGASGPAPSAAAASRRSAGATSPRATPAGGGAARRPAAVVPRAGGGRGGGSGGGREGRPRAGGRGQGGAGRAAGLEAGARPPVAAAVQGVRAGGGVRPAAGSRTGSAFSTVFPPPLLRFGGIASVERPWKTLPGSFGGTASRGAGKRIRG